MVAKTVKPASYMKNASSFLIDLAIALGMMFLLFYTVGQQWIFKAQGFGTYQQAQYSYIMKSGLATAELNDDGTYKTLKVATYEPANKYKDANGKEVYGFQMYADEVWNFYTAFLPSNGDDANGTPAVTFYTYAYCTETIYGISKSEGTGNTYFTHAYEADGVTYAEPVLKSDIQTKVDAGDTATLETLNAVFYRAASNGYSGYIADAVDLLSAQSQYKDPANQVNRIIYLSLIPSITIPLLIFFFIIPICVPQGKTLGKLILGIAVIGDDGYKAKKIFIVLHYFILLVEMGLLLLPSLSLGVTIVSLLLLIDFVVLVLSKRHQSLHDRLSKTVVVESRKRILFDSPEAEQDYVKTHPSSSVARLAEENGGLVNEPIAPIDSSTINGRKSAVSEEQVISEESVLDLSTINKHREIAHSGLSFDEIEQGKTPISQPEEKPAEPKAEPAKPEIKKKAASQKKAAPKKASAKKPAPKK